MLCLSTLAESFILLTSQPTIHYFRWGTISNTKKGIEEQPRFEIQFCNTLITLCLLVYRMMAFSPIMFGYLCYLKDPITLIIISYISQYFTCLSSIISSRVLFVVCRENNLQLKPVFCSFMDCCLC